MPAGGSEGCKRCSCCSALPPVQGVPEGVELSGRLEVQREVVSDGPEELEFKVRGGPQGG